ncbi:MAG: HAD hydrolase-like protein, partial [Gammaproteobacteria bacterium]|nr:HAD hydrolase-like protein [Gammaproteobacteria bacterium]
MSLITSISRADAIARYTEVAHRMPKPVNPESTVNVADLSELTDEFDVFVLDGFGVLNVGEHTIPGAVERVAQLQAMGKQVLVLTNGATLPVEKTVEKYTKRGMHFSLPDVVSSRNALEQAMLAEEDNILWGVIATDFAQIERLAPKTILLTDNANDYAKVDAFVFLSSLDWTHERQSLLHSALATRTRPVLVGNPDLVAPRESDMSMEPGLFAHELADAGVCQPRFYGKPFKNVFDIVAKRIDNVEPHRIAMVGDSLHTDILGGANYGWRTVLIKNHGLMKEADDDQCFAQTGIRPDFVAATT